MRYMAYMCMLAIAVAGFVCHQPVVTTAFLPAASMLSQVNLSAQLQCKSMFYDNRRILTIKVHRP